MKEIYEIDKQIQNLEEQRDGLTTKLNELLRKRTKILIENDEFCKLRGKYVVWNKYSSWVYFKVHDVELISRGAKLSGIGFDASFGSGGLINAVSVYSNRTLLATDTDLNDIREISQEEFTSAWKDFVNNFNEIINKN